MLVSAVGEFFKYQLVGSIVVFYCNWNILDQVKFVRQLSNQGIKATFSCNPKTLDVIISHQFLGVLYFSDENNLLLKKTNRQHFANWYKWLVLGDELPHFINNIRYDADVIYVKNNGKNKTLLENIPQPVYFNDVFVHPYEEASLHPWAYWDSISGLVVTHRSNRTTRRFNFKKYPLRIVSTTVHYSPETYNGTFTEYLRDSGDQQDSAIRCAYGTSALILESLNASEVVLASSSWSSLNGNESMLRMVETEVAELTGASLRILPERLAILDYILPNWPFGVGFTYLAERESSSNMYVEPFSSGVWWCCLGITLILAIMQRITARAPLEKEGAYFNVLATWLQQDASAVPEGISGRWSFMVMSVSAMLVHAYYTSAIVSALMSTGRGGPENLKALADSKYAIASENVEYMRYLFWETKTDWSELEYLKRKKMTSRFYYDIQRGAEMIRNGSTAYHTEYNQIYPHFKTFSDDKVCSLQHVDTIPEQLAWTVTAKRSQYTDTFRSRGAWTRETGLVHRTISRLRTRPPECRASLLAERVKLGDVTPLLATTMLGVVLSCTILGLEVLLAKIKKQPNIFRKSAVSETSTVEDEVFEYDYVD